MHIARFPEGEFFFFFLTIGPWIGFLSLTVMKNHPICTFINVILVRNKNCEFLQNLGTDSHVTLSVEASWMVTLFPLKQRKFTV